MTERVVTITTPPVNQRTEIFIEEVGRDNLTTITIDQPHEGHYNETKDIIHYASVTINLVELAALYQLIGLRLEELEAPARSYTITTDGPFTTTVEEDMEEDGFVGEFPIITAEDLEQGMRSHP
jgi:hypothetical protein